MSSLTNQSIAHFHMDSYLATLDRFYFSRNRKSKLPALREFLGTSIGAQVLPCCSPSKQKKVLFPHTIFRHDPKTQHDEQTMFAEFSRLCIGSCKTNCSDCGFLSVPLPQMVLGARAATSPACSPAATSPYS